MAAEKAEVFNQQPTKRPQTAATEPPPSSSTVESFVTSSQIPKVLPSKNLPKNINVYTSPCYSNFQLVYQHNLNQPSRSTSYSNLLLAKQPILYKTSQHQSAPYHLSVSYRQKSDLAIATSYQPLGSHRQAVDKPTFDFENSVPYRHETEYLYRNAHQTPVSNRQVNEEHRPNTHNSLSHPTTIYQRLSVPFRQGTDIPQS